MDLVCVTWFLELLFAVLAEENNASVSQCETLAGHVVQTYPQRHRSRTWTSMLPSQFLAIRVSGNFSLSTRWSKFRMSRGLKKIDRSMRLLWSLVFAARWQLTLGDLPVHCLRHQILGDWNFLLGTSGNVRSNCGHQRPDVDTVQPADLDHVAETRTVTFLQPNVATSPTDAHGSYTMIYDEGFEVRVDNMTFFSFFRFDPPFGNSSGVSRCGETARGWFRDESRNTWGCFVGRKATQPVSFLSLPVVEQQPSKDYDTPRDASWHATHVDKLNGRAPMWTARVYDRFVGLSLRQMNSYAGLHRPERASQVRHVRVKPHAAFLEVSGKESENRMWESQRC